MNRQFKREHNSTLELLVELPPCFALRYELLVVASVVPNTAEALKTKSLEVVTSNLKTYLFVKRLSLK